MTSTRQGEYMVFDRTAQYQAYNMASQTVPKTKQIIMLYDGIIRFMQQAKEAIKEDRIQDRFNLLVKASEVIMGLQSCLDHESGGEIAKILHDYYASIDMRILSIHRTNSLEICDMVIGELKEMRSAWHHVDLTVANQLAAAPPSPKPSPASKEPPTVVSSATENGSLQFSA